MKTAHLRAIFSSLELPISYCSFIHTKRWLAFWSALSGHIAIHHLPHNWYYYYSNLSEQLTKTSWKRLPAPS